MAERRTCRFCAADLVRRPGEKAARFARRQYCNVACSAQGTRNHLIPGARIAELDESRFAMTHSEIAERLGISRQMVAHCERRGLQKLWLALGGER